MPRYARRTRLPVPPPEAFAWHERPGAVERLSPPFQPVAVERRDPTLAEGSEVVLRLAPWAGRRSPRWRARHVLYDPPREFCDEQASGPFARWLHRHRFDHDGRGGTVLTDEIDYRLPLGALGAGLAGAAVGRRLDRVFAYRHRVTAADLAAHARARQKGVGPMHIAVTGSSGLIGQALVAFLSSGGHQVTRVVRRDPGDGEIGWDPQRGWLDADALRGVDVVVHLAGEPIAARRWSEQQKRRLLESRTKSTRLLADTIASMDDGPRVLVCSSGIDYYGDRGDETLDEDAGPGDSFLADVCVQWEGATAPAREAGARVVVLRTGMVLSPTGGALAKQLPLFRLGLGGRFGSGRQWVTWVSLDDIVGLIHHALTTEGMSGPVNAVSPEPVTNAEFTATLARVLGRPAVLPVPRLGPRLVLGEMGDTLLFHSKRAVPAKALESGYEFRHPNLEGCLRDLLGRPAA